jgi:hypothetical protein
MAATTEAPTQVMQGIVVPASSVDPQAFFRATRRLTFPTKTFTFAGAGLSDVISLLQTGIIAALSMRVSGNAVIAVGATASLARWPYDMVRALRISANGQSNLINTSGLKLRARDMMNPALQDRGVIPLGGVTGTPVNVGFGGASPGFIYQQGTLAYASEVWGLGSNVTGAAIGTYPYDLHYWVPVAFDQRSLIGAIFAQTASTDLTIAIDWAPNSDLVGTPANLTLSASVVIEAIAYSIPEVGGHIVVPDLSAFHAMIQTRSANPSNGVNEIRFSGQGVGRQLMRFYFQTFNGATPVQLNAAHTAAALNLFSVNYAQLGWRYGGNDTPEVITDGQHMRYVNERWFGVDFANIYGLVVWDFALENAFRDSVDEGAATDLRFLMEIPTGVALTSPFTEYVQETVFSAAVGA